MQPAQQHGRRIPLRILSKPTVIRFVRVSTFFAEVIQHIHSFRARGVMSVHISVAILFPVIAALKSGGSLCTVPFANFTCVMNK